VLVFPADFLFLPPPTNKSTVGNHFTLPLLHRSRKLPDKANNLAMP
jgi:hypothetical protein